MQDDQFDKLFSYIQEFRQEINERFEAIDGRFNKMEGAVDHLAGQYDTLVDELAAGTHAQRRVDDTLESHDVRLVRLEERAA